jgi:hypothetical protein
MPNSINSKNTKFGSEFHDGIVAKVYKVYEPPVAHGEAEDHFSP